MKTQEFKGKYLGKSTKLNNIDIYDVIVKEGFIPSKDKRYGAGHERGTIAVIDTGYKNPVTIPFNKKDWDILGVKQYV